MSEIETQPQPQGTSRIPILPLPGNDEDKPASPEVH
jgi:hypothetical protein